MKNKKDFPKVKNYLSPKTMDMLRETLGSDCACYVLIACSQPSSDGNMNVEMQFEGDETLAAFLVDNASQTFSVNHGLRHSQ